MKRIAISTLAVASMMVGATALNAQDERLSNLVKEVKVTNDLAKASQAKIDTLADQTGSLFSEYKSELKINDGLRAYNRQYEKAIAKQRTLMADIEQAIADVAKIKRQITPLMLDMVQSLEEFVANDIPFEKERRIERMSRLKEAIDNPDVSEVEKFRVTLQEYQAEVSYGRTVNAWEGVLEDGRSVNFVRIGRIGYYYQTKDRSETAAWDVNSDSWVVLGEESTRPINRMLKMINKMIPYEVTVLPVSAPEGK